MILLIDATTDPIRVGLGEAGTVVTTVEIAERRQLSRLLLQTIETVLSHAKLEVAELEAIAIVRGPGPFTSLRISLAVANALAAATERPLVGLPSAGSWEDAATAASDRLAAGDVVRQLLPEYGRPPTITPPSGG